MTELHWWLSVFTMNFRRVFAYRADFWINFFFSIFGQIGVAYFVWRAVYAAKGNVTLGGYAFDAMMFYYILTVLIIKVVKSSEWNLVALEIYDGSLSRYLVYPVSFLSYKFAAFLADALMAMMQFALTLLVFTITIGVPKEVSISATSAFCGFALMTVSMLFYFVMGSTLEMMAFWFDNVWNVVIMLGMAMIFFGGGLVPLSLFPPALREVAMLLPFFHMIAVPARLFMGTAGLPDFGYAVLVLTSWSVPAVLLLNFLWRRGLKQYTGVGM